MQRDPEDLHVARLLAGRPDDPSVWEKEAALEALVGPAAPERPRMVTWLTGTLAAAAAVALAFWPREQPELTARGNGTPPSVALVCAQDQRLGPCTRAATLFFEVSGASPDTHFAAFAQAPDGTIVWYFPPKSGRTSALGTQARTKLLAQGVKLADQHPAGRYRVFAIFSDAALDRATIKARLGPDLEGGRGLRVVTLALVVEESP